MYIGEAFERCYNRRYMAQLSLTVLGAPEVHVAGKMVRFPTRKAHALLIYLCVERGLHTREKLVALFWPDSDIKKGRGSLRLTLTYLREALAGATSTVPVSLLLLNQADALGFDFNSDWEMDLQRLEAATQVVHANRGVHTTEQRALL